MRSPFLALASSFLAVFTAPALAASLAPDMNIATTLASLVLVIILIVFLAWLLKRMKLSGIQGAGGALKVLKQLPIGQRERIVLLQVGEEQLLVGVTQHNISLLTKLEQPLAMDTQPSSEFANHLSQLLKTNDKK